MVRVMLNLKGHTFQFEENDKENYDEQFVTLFKEKLKKEYGKDYLSVELDEEHHIRTYTHTLFNLKGSMEFKINELYKIMTEEKRMPNIDSKFRFISWSFHMWNRYFEHGKNAYNKIIDYSFNKISSETKRKIFSIIATFIYTFKTDEKRIKVEFSILFRKYRYEMIRKILNNDHFKCYKYLFRFNELNKMYGYGYDKLDYYFFNSNAMEFIRLMESLYETKEEFIKEMIEYNPELIMNNCIFEYIHNFGEFDCHIRNAVQEVLNHLRFYNNKSKYFFKMEYYAGHRSYQRNFYQIQFKVFENEKFYKFIDKDSFIEVLLFCCTCILYNGHSIIENCELLHNIFEVADKFININKFMGRKEKRCLSSRDKRTLGPVSSFHPLLHIYFTCVKGVNKVYALKDLIKWWFEKYHNKLIYVDDQENNIYHYIEEAKWFNCFNKIINKVTCDNNVMINNQNKLGITPHELLNKKFKSAPHIREVYKLAGTRLKFDECNFSL